MNKINIVYITCFGSMQGGGQRSLCLLMKHLDKERFCPFLVVPEDGGLKREVEGLGMKVYVLPPARLRSLNIAAILRTLRALSRIIEETQAHLISTDSVRETFYANRAARRRGVPVLLHLRVTDSSPWVDRILYGLVDRMIAVSRAAASRFDRWDKGKKIAVVYNGAELDTLAAAAPRPADGTLRLGYFGRLEERKGIDVLIRAVRRLKEEPLSVRIFGEGENAYVRRLKELAGDDDRIVFDGFVADAAHRMRLLDAVVLPSRYGEGLSRALIEAMALARPVIVSNIPSNPELVGDGLNAFIFRNGDDADLARLLGDILERPGLLHEAGALARRRAEVCFDVAKNTRSIEEIYRQTARRVVSRGPGVRGGGMRPML